MHQFDLEQMYGSIQKIERKFYYDPVICVNRNSVIPLQMIVLKLTVAENQ